MLTFVSLNLFVRTLFSVGNDLYILNEKQRHIQLNCHVDIQPVGAKYISKVVTILKLTVVYP